MGITSNKPSLSQNLAKSKCHRNFLSKRDNDSTCWRAEKDEGRKKKVQNLSLYSLNFWPGCQQLFIVALGLLLK